MNTSIIFVSIVRMSNKIRILQDEIDECDQWNDELDDSWINEFERSDQLYEDFYPENVDFLFIQLIYLNRENEIIHLKKEPYILSVANQFRREDYENILMRHSSHNQIKYSLHSMLKYHFHLDPEDVPIYLRETNTAHSVDPFLSVIQPPNSSQPLYLDKTIRLFQDLNELVLVFTPILPTTHPTKKERPTRRHQFAPKGRSFTKKNRY